MLGLAAVIFAAAVLPGVTMGASFDNVQIFATTSTNLPYSFTFSAYNLTGSLVASYQGPYPAAAFELPSGEYLFTVSAVYQSYIPCLGVCPLPGPLVTESGGSTSSGNSSTPQSIMYRVPVSEYGYDIATVTSAQTLNIHLMNVTGLQTSGVAVKVTYANGTAAAGATVSASVVGQWYYWWGEGSNTTMYGQTDVNGVVTLVLPRAPVVVTAWRWVPVYIPAVNRTITVDVGGQQVNVTAYWEPTYVGLSGAALVTPPASSVHLTLVYQQPDYWVVPAGVLTSQTSGGTTGPLLASQGSATPSSVAQAGQSQQQYYLPAQIPTLESATVGGGVPTSLAALVGLGGVAVGFASAAVFLSRRKGPAKAP